MAIILPLAKAPAWATEQQPQQKPSGTNQPARTVIQRAAAKLQTDLTKDRVRGVQLRAMRDADSEDGTASARAEPRYCPPETTRPAEPPTGVRRIADHELWIYCHLIEPIR